MCCLRIGAWVTAIGLGLSASARQAVSQVPVGTGDSVLNLGTTGYASLPDNQVQNFNPRTNFSVEVALNIQANAAGGRWPIILGKKYSPPLADPGFALAINQGQFKTVGQQLYAVVSDGTQQANLSSRSFQGIVHAVMTWDAGNKVLTLYMNGAMEAGATNALLNCASVTNGSALELGGPSNLGQPLRRDILFARLWNRLLSASEVSAAWTQFNSLGQHVLSSGFDTTALVSQWLMDATCSTNGGAGTTNIRDLQGNNHLLLNGSVSLWQGNGVLALQSPANGATGVSKSVTLKAAGGLGALGASPVKPVQYQFQIDETNTFDSPALKTSGWLTGYGMWKPVLKPATQYFWRVSVQDSSSAPVASSYAATNSFTTRAAADWYVRPGVYTNFDPNTGAPIPVPGVYGAQDGTSYANAWNGIFSITWGEGGVEPGDNVYVCGTHSYTAQNNSFLGAQATTYISESGYSTDYPITIRMDSPAESGVLWGVLCNAIGGGPTWYGPDANGVYWSSNLLYSADYWANGTNIVLLNRETATTWTNDAGASFTTNGVWYVKTPDGSSPAGRICTSSLGYRFHLCRSSYIRFLNCRLRNAVPAFEMANWVPQNDTQTALPLSSYITFDGCDLRYGSEIAPAPGNDHWAIKNSELAFGQYGVYTFLNSRSSGANYLTVQSNYIHDMGTPRFPNQDAHGVGVQGGTGHLIERNHIENTGSAIEFWTYSQPMSNHVVRFNFIKNIHIMPVTGGDGIVVSGDNAASVIGLRTGFKIYGNIIVNPGVGATQSWQGSGIGSNCKDFIDIYDNVIYNPVTGISMGVISNAVQTRIANNIIVNPSGNYFTIVGSGTSTNVFIDYNLFFPATGLSAPLNIYPSVLHDQHSVFANPMFVSTTPSNAPDFKLLAGSPAIKAGIWVGLTRDFAGSSILLNVAPDIGAYEYAAPGRPLPPTGLNAVPQ